MTDTTDDDTIRALLARLARPHPSGGAVIERAAILAEGGDFTAVVAWITAHAGEPEGAVAPGRGAGGLHGGRETRATTPPRRFVLPAGALG